MGFESSLATKAIENIHQLYLLWGWCELVCGGKQRRLKESIGQALTEMRVKRANHCSVKN